MKKTEMSQIQKKLYDGRDAEYRPIYENEKYFRTYMTSHIFEAKTHKILGYSLKAAKNISEIEKLGLKSGMKVLDAGCGPGILINQIKAIYGVNAYGVDLSTLAIKRAKEAGDKKIEYKNGKLEKIPFPTGYFDAVVSFDVLEHVTDKDRVLKEMVRVLKPGGKLLVYAISINDKFTWHWALRAITAGRYGVDTEGGHFRENFVDPAFARKSVIDAGACKVKVNYFHSFFTLLIDEFLFKIQGKLRTDPGLGADDTAAKISGKKSFAYLIMKFIRPVVEAMDIPWSVAGYSNGFFINAQKGDKKNG
jgi:2-polyprenyl-3-methyl-5-hydroxy-6-metoxy-1,4-benzoquinol methylase